MAQNAHNLIWIDLEMTGLDTSTDSIIEVATVVTDKDLNVLAKGPVIAVFQPESVLVRMDDWNHKHHGQSGLIERVRESTISEGDAEAVTIEFLRTAASSPVACPDWRPISIIAVSTSRLSRNLPAVGRPR
jgi:oligoribonuclease